MRMIVGVAVVVAVGAAAGCTERSVPSAPSTLVNGGASAVSTRRSPQPGAISLTCSGPIGSVSSPTSLQSSLLDVVGLDITSTLQVSDGGGTDPHRLFAKTGLLVHVGREADLTVPAAWATRVSIAWGNHAAKWTSSLQIPACPAPPSGPGQWLAFPGGFSLDEPACVPLEVRAGNEVRTVHVSVGSRCPG
jgi:hypothetical protein